DYCAAAPGLSVCGDGCADLAADAANCGSCGNLCPGYCSAASCIGDGALRFEGGNPGVLAGLLQIFHDGQGAYVCADVFSSNEANAACRQLGYSTASQFYQYSGYQPTAMNGLTC